MSTHEIAFRIDRYITALILVVFFGACVAYMSKADDADNAQQRKVSTERAKQAAQQAEWDKLDRDARRMTAYEQIK